MLGFWQTFCKQTQEFLRTAVLSFQKTLCFLWSFTILAQSFSPFFLGCPHTLEMWYRFLICDWALYWYLFSVLDQLWVSALNIVYYTKEPTSSRFILKTCVIPYHRFVVKFIVSDMCFLLYIWLKIQPISSLLSSLLFFPIAYLVTLVIIIAHRFING